MQCVLFQIESGKDEILFRHMPSFNLHTQKTFHQKLDHQRQVADLLERYLKLCRSMYLYVQLFTDMTSDQYSGCYHRFFYDKDVNVEEKIGIVQKQLLGGMPVIIETCSKRQSKSITSVMVNRSALGVDVSRRGGLSEEPRNSVQGCNSAKYFVAPRKLQPQRLNIEHPNVNCGCLFVTITLLYINQTQVQILRYSILYTTLFS